MLRAITDGSLASSPRILSAGGHDEHPCEVNSPITARGSAWAGRMMATIAHKASAPDHREIKLWAIIAVILETRTPCPIGVSHLVAPKPRRRPLHRPPPPTPPLTSQ